LPEMEAAFGISRFSESKIAFYAIFTIIHNRK
jgi:hypothetical protein